MPLDAIAREVGDVGHAGAEAGGTGHGAVAARQAAARDVVPSWVVEVGVQQLLGRSGVHDAPHALAGTVGHRVRGRVVVRRGGPVRRGVQRSPARIGADLDDEAVPVVVEQLGQRQVEATRGTRSRAHRDAEAGARGIAAVHGDQQHLVPPPGVHRVDGRPLDEHAVLDGDGRQLARAHTDEGIAGHRRRVVEDPNTSVVGPFGRPHRVGRREQVPLPRVGTDGVAEQGVVVTARQPVVPGRLLVGPPRGRSSTESSSS